MQAGEIEVLYRVHGHSVLRRARGLLRNEEDARDVLHEVFTSLVDRPAQLRGESSMTTWLYSATTHGCLNRLRNERGRRKILEVQGSVSSEESTENPERQAMLRQLLSRLPEELAQIAVYRYLDGMTHDEIASVLDCSRRHVGDLITRMHALIDEETS